MKTQHTIMLAAALAACPLHATLQEEADNLAIPEKLDMLARQLEIPQIDGTDVRIIHSDYEEIIGLDGKVHGLHAKVRLNFELTRGSEKAVSREYVVQVDPVQPKGGRANAPQTIPQVLDWGCFHERPKTLDLAKAAHRGISIPPCMKGVQEDLLKEFKMPAADAKDAAVKLELNTTPDPSLGSEGYNLTIHEEELNPGSVTIIANSPAGLYWGTRTLLQMLRQGHKLTAGSITDIPRYPVRGFVFDVGRLPVPYEFLKQVVDTMAWYKLNDLQLHLNDNFIFLDEYTKAGRDPFKEAYAAFRMESNVKGKDGTPLTAKDVSYTKKQMRRLIDYAKARGVNIVPEFDAPAHALALTRVRPELMLKTADPRSIEELDASKPETLEFIKGLWDEYLLPGKDKKQRAVFGGCTVHIGADEFKGDNEDYRRFTDAMLKHIKARGYTPRLWGSLTMKKGSTPVTAEGVQMNIWSKDWNLPRPAINEGYDIINTMDSQLYIVPFANYYRMDKNLKGLYENFVPNQIGAQGRPLAERLPAGHPQLLGAAFAVWNDMIDLRSNGYTYEDLRGMIAETAAAFAQKAWGPEELPRSFEDHQKLRQTIGDAPHGVTIKPNPKKH